MTVRTASDVRDRFRSEQSQIRDYVTTVEGIATLEDYDIRRMNGILDSHQLGQLTERSTRTAEGPFSQEQIDRLMAEMEVLRPKVEQRIAHHDSFLAAAEWNGGNNEIVGVGQDRYFEWIDFFSETLAEGTTEEEKTRLIECTLHQQDWQESDAPVGVRARKEIEAGAAGNEAQIERALMRHAIASVEKARYYGKASELRSVLGSFSRFAFAGRIRNPEAEINLLRQGFILLMTAFDAAVFDLMRVALRRDFFGLIAHLSKQDKIQLKTLTDAGSFLRFKAEMIDATLKGRYVKEMLHELNRIIDCFLPSTGERTFGHLIEIVLRRNIHVHNRGVVDSHYLEQKMNIDGFVLGDMAAISEVYWVRANLLCDEAVERIADWADSCSPKDESLND